MIIAVHGTYHTPFWERFIAKEAKKLKSDRNESFQDPRPKQRRRVTFRDTKHAVANRELIRVTFRDTTHVEAHSLKLDHSHWAMMCTLSKHSPSRCTLITSSSALDTGLAAPIQETSPLTPYKKERLADRKSSRPSTLCAELLWELCEEFVNNLNSVSWHIIKFDSFQDPSSSLYGSDSKHIKIDSFQDPV